jgi:PAS domain-containing protein
MRRRFLLYLAAVHLLFAVVAVTAYWRYWNDKALLVVAEILLLLSFLAGAALVRSLFGTLDLVRSGAQLLEERDFGTRLREVGQVDMDQLVGVYNRMVDELREERIRVEEQHHFMERILLASPSGILTLDLDGRIATVNPAAERLLRETRAASSASASKRRADRTRPGSLRSRAASPWSWRSAGDAGRGAGDRSSWIGDSRAPSSSSRSSRRSCAARRRPRTRSSSA